MAATRRPPFPAAPIGVPATDLKGAPVVEASDAFKTYMRGQEDAINAAAQSVVTPIALTAQNASKATTDLTASAAAGLYSFQFYASVKTAAGVSSSLTATLGWTENAQPKTKVFTAMTGNTVTTSSSEWYLVSVDGGSPITYALTYASNAAGAMIYNFYAVLSSVAASS